MSFRDLALHLGLLPPRESDLDRWERTQDVRRIADVALSDPRRRIRLRAVQALSRLACRGSTRALRRALKDRSRSVSLAAATGIRSFDASAASAAEKWWRDNDADLGTASFRQLIDKSKMERFASFKKQVLAQANKGRFYG